MLSRHCLAVRLCVRACMCLSVCFCVCAVCLCVCVCVFGLGAASAPQPCQYTSSSQPQTPSHAGIPQPGAAIPLPAPQLQSAHKLMLISATANPCACVHAQVYRWEQYKRVLAGQEAVDDGLLQRPEIFELEGSHQLLPHTAPHARGRQVRHRKWRAGSKQHHTNPRLNADNKGAPTGQTNQMVHPTDRRHSARRHRLRCRDLHCPTSPPPRHRWCCCSPFEHHHFHQHLHHHRRRRRLSSVAWRRQCRVPSPP
jgi:hypothetical protein